jgi:Rieske 2Fe-2S family protein
MGGFIFVNFDPDCPSLKEYLEVDGIEEASEFLKLDELHLVDTHTFEIECNWKLLPENLIDVYHVQVLHKDTFGEQFGADDYDFRLTKYG